MLLIEKFINLTDSQAKQKYLNDVLDILNTSYSKIGGLQGVTPEYLLSDKFLWKIVWRKDHISAVSIYKMSPTDRKGVAAGTDGTPQGKADLYMIMSEDVNQPERHAWVEVSGAPEHMYRKKGMQPIPVDTAEAILNKRGKKLISKSSDGYHYTRLIGGEPHEKIMLGYDTSDIM